MVYSIDLKTLLQMLKEFHQTGRLQAPLPSNVMGQKGGGHILLDLVDGEIFECIIENASGRILSSGEKALQQAHRLGKLDWQLTPKPISRPGSNNTQRLPITGENWSQFSPSQMPGDDKDTQRTTDPHHLSIVPARRTDPLNIAADYSPDVLSLLIPRRTTNVTPEQLQNLSFRQRRVFMLIDGQRTVKDILALIAPSPKKRGEAQVVLQELVALALIRIG
jgi:hypothetical protein